MSAPPSQPGGRRPLPTRCESLSRYRARRGISLVELILFIIIVGVGVAGLLLVFSVTTRASGDPLIQKQMLAIAESLLEEIEAKPFTYCDPDDANAATALNTAGCAAAIENPGPEALDVPPTGPLETRTGAVRPFDNVNDYGVAAGPPLTINSIVDITSGAAIAALAGYSATISVADSALSSALGTVPSDQSLLITVTVNGPRGDSLTLQGYRTRYAPNAVP